MEQNSASLIPTDYAASTTLSVFDSTTTVVPPIFFVDDRLPNTSWKSISLNVGDSELPGEFSKQSEGVLGTTLRDSDVNFPMPSVSGVEKIQSQNWKALMHFRFLCGRNFLKRISHDYFFSYINVASVEVKASRMFWCFGIISGIMTYVEFDNIGNLIFTVLLIILVFPLLVGFVGFDGASLPKTAKILKGLS
jgi:hypothetical protein